MHLFITYVGVGLRKVYEKLALSLYYIYKSANYAQVVYQITLFRRSKVYEKLSVSTSSAKYIHFIQNVKFMKSRQII